ncbi:MAG: hypothetical protein WCJ30_09785 [Deltaproteobacteria bacterium]
MPSTPLTGISEVLAETVVARMLSVVDVFAERVAARVLSLVHVHDDYYSQHVNPLGKRPYLEAARRGDFASFSVGKLVLARRIDVNAWIETHRRDKIEALRLLDPAAEFAKKGIFPKFPET